METYLKGILLLTLLTLTAFSCDRAEEAFSQASGARHVQRWGDLEAVLQVTDLQGKPKSSFREGENFLLSFTVKNRGKEDARIVHWDFPFVIQDFLAVYKIIQEADGKNWVGKPFKSGPSSYDLAPQVVPAESQLEYVFPWMSETGQRYVMPIYSKPERNVNKRHYEAVETQPLSKGRYYSGFTLEQEGKELAFRVKFEVK
ncbi:hypothetical protein BH24BAC1_BH24BAC1_38750 [soil metagenome]